MASRDRRLLSLGSGRQRRPKRPDAYCLLSCLSVGALLCAFQRREQEGFCGVLNVARPAAVQSLELPGQPAAPGRPDRRAELPPPPWHSSESGFQARGRFSGRGVVQSPKTCSRVRSCLLGDSVILRWQKRQGIRDMCRLGQPCAALFSNRLNDFGSLKARIRYSPSIGERQEQVARDADQKVPLEQRHVPIWRATRRFHYQLDAVQGDFERPATSLQ